MQEMIQSVLGDPEKLAELRSVAEKLGLGGNVPGGGTEPESALSAPAPSQEPEPRREALLQALLPYLDPSRRERLERAMRVAKLSRLAGAALQNYGTLFEAGAV